MKETQETFSENQEIEQRAKKQDRLRLAFLLLRAKHY